MRPTLLVMAFLAIMSVVALSQENTKGGSGILFDAVTKKYFVAGQTQLVLKQSEDSGPVDGIEYSVDGLDYQPYTGGIQFSNEGKHNLKFRAISPLGYAAPVKSVDVFVDLTPPTTRLTFAKDRSVEGAGITYIAVGSTVVLEAEDNLSGVAKTEYSWDQKEFLPYQRPVVIERTGKQTLYVRSIDQVGNAEPLKPVEFVIDGAAPTSSMNITGTTSPIVVGGKKYLACSDMATVSLTASDGAPAAASNSAAQSVPIPQMALSSDVKAIWLSMDGKPYTQYHSSFYLLKDGPHLVRFYAQDNVGNKEEANEISLYVVSTPPRSKLIPSGKMVYMGGMNFVTPATTFAIVPEDSTAGVDRVQVKADTDTQFHLYREPIRFETPGPHSLTFMAVDKVGNREQARTFQVTVQTVSPETTIQTAQPTVLRGGVSYSASPNVVSLNVHETGVGIERTLISINDGPFTEYSRPVTLTSDVKVYKIAYKSRDRLGNEEPLKTVTYHMVGATPVVDVYIPGLPAERAPAATTGKGKSRKAHATN